MIVVKVWNGSKALPISRNGLDCYIEGLMIYYRPIHGPKKILAETFFRSLQSCNMQMRLKVSLLNHWCCIIGSNQLSKDCTWSAVPNALLVVIK